MACPQQGEGPWAEAEEAVDVAAEGVHPPAGRVVRPLEGHDVTAEGGPERRGGWPEGGRRRWGTMGCEEKARSEVSFQCVRIIQMSDIFRVQTCKLDRETEKMKFSYYKPDTPPLDTGQGDLLVLLGPLDGAAAVGVVLQPVSVPIEC